MARLRLPETCCKLAQTASVRAYWKMHRLKVAAGFFDRSLVICSRWCVGAWQELPTPSACCDNAAARQYDRFSSSTDHMWDTQMPLAAQTCSSWASQAIVKQSAPTPAPVAHSVTLPPP